MRQAGVRSGATWVLVVGAVLAPTAACTAIAGIGDFGVDTCFDGCDSGGGTSMPDAPGNKDAAALPDAPVQDTSVTPDAVVDASSCPCPAGTTLVNGKCTVTYPPDPPASIECKTPVQLPDCAIQVVLHVCDNYPKFPYSSSSPTCKGSLSFNSRPTGFIRLGKSPAANKWTVLVHGAYSVSTPNALCTEGGIPCFADGTASTVINSTNATDNALLAIGMRSDVSGCQDIDVEATPN